MQNQPGTFTIKYNPPDIDSPEFPASNVYNPETRESINKLINYLEATGKICPKPWYWERFFILFNPRYEPCWLSNWWKTTPGEKKELFRKQLFYLAYRTDRYARACRFLYGLDEMNWLYE